MGLLSKDEKVVIYNRKNVVGWCNLRDSILVYTNGKDGCIQTCLRYLAKNNSFILRSYGVWYVLSNLEVFDMMIELGDFDGKKLSVVPNKELKTQYAQYIKQGQMK